MANTNGEAGVRTSNTFSERKGSNANANVSQVNISKKGQQSSSANQISTSRKQNSASMAVSVNAVQKPPLAKKEDQSAH